MSLYPFMIHYDPSTDLSPGLCWCVGSQQWWTASLSPTPRLSFFSGPRYSLLHTHVEYGMYDYVELTEACMHVKQCLIYTQLGMLALLLRVV